MLGNGLGVLSDPLIDAWKPHRLSGLQGLWYAREAIHDIGTGAPALVGQTVARLPDASGNSWHLDQLTAIKQSTLRLFNGSDLSNGVACHFDGVDDQLITTDSRLLPIQRTIFLVVSTQGTPVGLWGLGNTNVGTSGYTASGMFSYTDRVRLVRRGSDYADIWAQANSHPSGVILRYICQTGRLVADTKIWINGVLQVPSQTSGPSDIGNTGITDSKFTVGMVPGIGYANGLCGVQGVCEGWLANEDIANLDAWMKREFKL